MANGQLWPINKNLELKNFFLFPFQTTVSRNSYVRKNNKIKLFFGFFILVFVFLTIWKLISFGCFKLKIDFNQGQFLRYGGEQRQLNAPWQEYKILKIRESSIVQLKPVYKIYLKTKLKTVFISSILLKYKNIFQKVQFLTYFSILF